jgi:hypothetical protein
MMAVVTSKFGKHPKTVFVGEGFLFGSDSAIGKRSNAFSTYLRIQPLCGRATTTASPNALQSTRHVKVINNNVA